MLEALGQLIDLLGYALPSIIGSVIGSFLGIFGGYRLNSRSQKKRDERLVERHLRGMRGEILQAISLLENRKLQLLPDDLWQSAVNSGHLALFPSEEKEDLRQGYFNIDKVNYMAIKSADLNVQFLKETNEENRKAVGLAWKAVSDEGIRMADSTLTYLRSVAKKEWFTELSPS